MMMLCITMGKITTNVFPEGEKLIVDASPAAHLSLKAIQEMALNTFHQVPNLLGVAHPALAISKMYIVFPFDARYFICAASFFVLAEALGIPWCMWFEMPGGMYQYVDLGFIRAEANSFNLPQGVSQ